MKDLKKKKRLLKIIIVFMVCFVIFRYRPALELIPIPLLLMIFSCGIGIGGLIAISQSMKNDDISQ